MVKRAARKQLREKIGQLSSEERQAKSCAVCQKLGRTKVFQQAKVVMLYLSLEHEIDTTCLIKKSLKAGKKVLVPSVEWHQNKIVPVTIESLECEMHQDRHGLRHPKNGTPTDITEIDLVVVPGVGFDLQGDRLGKGGGFYDRFLGTNGFKGVSCGLGFEEQVVDKLPTYDHDVRLNMLVTDKHVRRFKKTGAKDG